MDTGIYQKQLVLTPENCDMQAAMSPLAAFTIFQGIAAEHAEKIGVGGAAMAKRGEFWLTTHSRVDFFLAGISDAGADGADVAGAL